jgi:hypothetical protein
MNKIFSLSPCCSASIHPSIHPPPSHTHIHTHTHTHTHWIHNSVTRQHAVWSADTEPPTSQFLSSHMLLLLILRGLKMGGGVLQWYLLQVLWKSRFWNLEHVVYWQRSNITALNSLFLEKRSRQGN